MKSIRIAVLFAIILLPLTASAAVFNRPLRLGDNGADVIALQRLLNKNTQTQIAVSGIGSPGQESSYFGLKTKQAVARFQELHAADILTPSGLVSGTGLVGSRTRAKLNALSDSSAADSGKPPIIVFSLSPSSAVPGAAVIVRGTDFGSEPLTVSFGKQVLPAKVHSDASSAVSFSIPPETPSGLYSVIVRSSTGSISNTLKVRVVGGGPAAAGPSNGPHIAQLSPSRGGYGTVLTIIGSGFSLLPTNTVQVAATVFNSVASPDGRTLTVMLPFNMEGLSFDREIIADILDLEVPLGVEVKNADGESSIETFNFTFYGL